jgi:hypothetical protein
MAITYKYVVTTMNVAPQENGLDNVIKDITWAIVGNDGTNEVSATSLIASRMQFVPPQSGAFKAFNEFTEAEIAAWLEANVNTIVADSLKANIVKQLADKANTAIATPTKAPWRE